MPDAYQDDPGVQWMLAYREGSEPAFDRLVETYSGQVYSLFTRFLGHVPEREDLVQEVFLRVVRARRRYQPTARFSTWLYRIAFNLAVNRSERSQPEVSLDGRAPDGSPQGLGEELADLRVGDPSDGLERSDVVAAVRAAIASLPDTQRMALILARYEELSQSEIAAVLDSSEKAVKSLVHRARESLRARLAPLLEQERA
jgi:RNA polymerase sigma-70 factor (ECF subfamily)